MSQKRILFLGAAYAQIPIIEAAKKRKWYVITCDYLPDNPGHKLANEYYNISTTDYEGVLELAKKVKPGYVVAYASDPAAPVAAYISEKMGLPGNSFQSVRLLSEKDLFRSFLEKNGFNAPRSTSINQGENIFEKTKPLNYPFIIKPVDSSGSKGVKRVTKEPDLLKEAEYAFSFARNKRIIAEEFIESDGPQLHGDGFVVDGDLVFSYLGDHHYNENINPFVPYSTTWPSIKDNEIIIQVENELKKVIKLSGYKNGPVNIEVRITQAGEIYIMEIGPRSGGNFVPQVIQHATDFDMVEAMLDQFKGKQIIMPDQNKRNSVAYYVIHSEQEGLLTELKIDKSLLPFIKELHQYIKPGDTVKAFHGANAAIGVIILSFESFQEMGYYIDNIRNFIRIKIKELS